MRRDRMDDVYWALRAGLGASAFLAGADKFTNLLADWEKYLAPEVEERVPVSGGTFMKLVGVIEMAAGAGILTRQKWAPWVTGAWLLGIAGNLVLNEDYDIAVRDVNMALAAYALGRMEQRREARRIESPEEERILPDVESQAA